VSASGTAATHTFWELTVCAWRGHVTFAPTDEEQATRLRGTTALGEAWRCLRCGGFAAGAPQRRGPVSEAPVVLRGQALRQAIVLRALAVERGIRAVLIALVALAVWRFQENRESIQAAFDRDLPLLRSSGIQVDQLTLIHEFERALAARPSTLTLVALALVVYALLELVEGIGLWLLTRWGEYFAVIATSFFLPLEIYDLTRGITPLRLAAFAINVAAVVYLVASKRLFGVRGGRAAYEEERRGERILDTGPVD
jgi:uncharacterized membrane protein (DUF2068 family)